ELVMPAGAGAVEVNVEHLSRLPFTDLSRELLPLPPRGSVIPAEAVNVIDRRVEFFRVRAVTRRQHYPGAHGDGAPMKRGQHRALEFDELHVFSVCRFEARRRDAAERQFNWRVGGGV